MKQSQNSMKKTKYKNKHTLKTSRNISRHLIANKLWKSSSPSPEEYKIKQGTIASLLPERFDPKTVNMLDSDSDDEDDNDKTETNHNQIMRV